MIDFKHIIQTAGQDKLTSKIHLGNNPVWDYKIGPQNTIYLITGDIGEVEECETITLDELRKYALELNIPYELVVLKCETLREDLTQAEWKQDVLQLQ